MKKYIEMVVTATVLVAYDDTVMDAEAASEETRERLNTRLELDGDGGVSIEDVRLDAIDSHSWDV